MRTRTCLFLVGFLLLSCGRDPTPTPVPTSTATAAPTPTLVPTPTALVVESIIDVVLRAGPGDVFEETAQVPRGSLVSLMGSGSGRNCWEWVLVRTADGAEGWIMPVLLNLDIGTMDLPSAATPTPSAPLPAACSAEMALVQINNRMGKTMDVYMSGPEPGFNLSIDDGVSRLVCLTPGDYCYDLTDGAKHERGGLFFPGGRCTCWHWGGPPPSPGSCPCSEDPADYTRP